MKRSSSRRSGLASGFIEPLESRQLLSGVKIETVSADNRGEILIGLSGAVLTADVNKDSVQVYSAGADGILGNADDARVPASVRYTTSNNRITIEAQVTANEGYRVKLTATRLRDSTQTPIDGEFNGSGVPSGNGKAGGNFEFQVKNDKSATPTAKMSTSAGTIELKLYRSLKPVSVANFLSYANAGDDDGIFVTRSINGFVEQLGSLGVSSSNTVITEPVGSAIKSEFSTNGIIPNTAYTVAFALSGSTNNTATNQFFFNLGDNSQNLDSQNGGFTVFATAANATSEATLTAIAAKSTTSITSPDESTDTSDVPVNSTYNSANGLNPSQDLVVVRRVAVQDLIAALAPATAAAAKNAAVSNSPPPSATPASGAPSTVASTVISSPPPSSLPAGSSSGTVASSIGI